MRRFLLCLLVPLLFTACDSAPPQDDPATIPAEIESVGEQPALLKSSHTFDIMEGDDVLDVGETYMLKHLKFQYQPPEYEVTSSDEQSCFIQTPDGCIIIASVDEEIGATMQDFFATVAMQLPPDGYEILEEGTVTIRGKSWEHLTFSLTILEEPYIQTMLLAEEYGYSYAVSYLSPVKNTDALHDKALMISSLRFEANEPDNTAIKQLLQGEWEARDDGYLVFMADDTMNWFQDARKEDDNVIIGTYSCLPTTVVDNEVLADGFMFTVTYTEARMDGEAMSFINPEELFFGYETDEAGIYKVINSNKGNAFMMQKVSAE